MTSRRRNTLTIVVTYVLMLAIAYGINWFNYNIASRLSGGFRLISIIIVWWPLLIPTIVFMLRDKENAKDIGLTKEKLPWQLLNGLFVAIGALAIFVILPAFFGVQMTHVGSLDIWSIPYQLAYMLLAVATIEEVIFRGHLFKKLLGIKESRWFAITMSSVIFGLFHIYNWNIFQIIFAALIGFYFCVCREKIKQCTLLSLIIGHAVYNTIGPIFTALYFSL